MTRVLPPPTYEVLTEKDGKARLPWLLFFNKLFQGDSGTIWTPAFTNLTAVGTPTITGKTYKINDYIAYFGITIVPGTNTSSTAGTTYVNNFPLDITGDGACFALSGFLGSNAGVCDTASNRIYVPSWTTVTVPLTIVGIVEAT